MSLHGDYEDIRRFIYQVESGTDFIVIDSIALASGCRTRITSDVRLEPVDLLPCGTRWSLNASASWRSRRWRWSFWPSPVWTIRAVGRPGAANAPGSAAAANAAKAATEHPFSGVDLKALDAERPEPEAGNRNPFRFKPTAVHRHRRHNSKRPPEQENPIENGPPPTATTAAHHIEVHRRCGRSPESREPRSRCSPTGEASTRAVKGRSSRADIA